MSESIANIYSGQIEKVQGLFIEQINSAIERKLDPQRVRAAFVMLFDDTVAPVLKDMLRLEREFNQRLQEMGAKLVELQAKIDALGEGDEWKTRA